jgi:hypothetical protein
LIGANCLLVVRSHTTSSTMVIKKEKHLPVDS